MVSQNPQRPTLSTEDRRALQDAAPKLNTIRSVIDDLDAIGVDVSAERDLLEQTEKMRSGLLERFSSTQPNGAARRGRTR